MNWVNIGSGNGLSPVRRQAITWTNADLLSIGPLGTNFREIWIEILTFWLKKMRLKMTSAKMATILYRGRWVKVILGTTMYVVFTVVCQVVSHQRWHVRGFCICPKNRKIIDFYLLFKFTVMEKNANRPNQVTWFGGGIDHAPLCFCMMPGLWCDATEPIYSNCRPLCERLRHVPLTRYLKLWVAHAPGCRERFPRHRLQRKPLVSDPGIHHGTCVTHVPWCMSGSLSKIFVSQSQTNFGWIIQ